MGLWRFVFAGASIVLVLSIIYLMWRAGQAGFVRKIREKNRPLALVCSLWPVVLCLPFLAVGVVAFAIAMIHLCVIWALCDLVAFIIRKARKAPRRKNYITGYIAVGLTVCYLGCGWFFAHHVFRTDRAVETAKELGTDRLRIAAIADLHVGITLSGEEFAEECARINETEPDAVVFVGDFVDDDSTREDMEKACEALGTLKTKYGVFWVYGNHDRGYYRHQDYDAEALEKKLAENNVRVLKDEKVMINENVCIVGREDKSRSGRKSAAELMEGIDPSDYVIMLDHQPNDYDAEAAAGADLVISGHTHGGHIFPAGPIGMLTRANDRIYGTEQRGDTTFIVTSGISGWGIPFKTFAISEFVIIDITGRQ